MQSLQAAQAEQQKNREAESAHVRRSVWGQQEGAGDGEGDEDMGHTILGDVNHPAPIVMNTSPQSNPLVTASLLLAGLLASGISGAAAGYLFAPNSDVPKEVESSSFDDESVSIGLGRIEDYMEDN